MVNQKGIIKIIEASLAVLIVLGVLILLGIRNQTAQEIDLTKRITPLLEEIAKNNSLRSQVLNYNLSEGRDEGINLEIISNLSSFALKRLNNRINYSISICDIIETCVLNIEEIPKTNIYSNERIISSLITEREFSPKKVRIFLWLNNK